MYAFEELAGGYFAVIAGAAPFAPSRGYRRATAAVTAIVLVGLVAVAAAYAGGAVRMWLPFTYLIAGYWLPALLVADEDAHGTAPVTRFERWLRRHDRGLRARLFRIPRLVREVVELAYLMCYPLVPISFAIVWMFGTPDDVDRFWITVLAAGFACYVSLPWLVSRPPRAASARAATHDCRTQATNVTVLRHVSHQLNTFPSGHVAVALAAAAAVASVMPAAGAVVALTAVAIAVGAVAGGYHYVLDVVLGVVVAIAAVAMVFA